MYVLFPPARNRSGFHVALAVKINGGDGGADGVAEYYGCPSLITPAASIPLPLLLTPVGEVYTDAFQENCFAIPKPTPLDVPFLSVPREPTSVRVDYILFGLILLSRIR